MKYQKGVSVQFLPETIVFKNYPYKPSVASQGKINLLDIQEIHEAGLWLKKGELVFVPSTYKNTLRKWGHSHHFPRVKRISVWNLILKCFWAPEFNEVQERETFDSLKSCDISPELCRSYRKRFEKIMFEYLFEAGDFVDSELGLRDLLDAHVGHLVHRSYQLSESDFKTLYFEVMAVEQKGLLIPH